MLIPNRTLRAEGRSPSTLGSGRGSTAHTHTQPTQPGSGLLRSPTGCRTGAERGNCGRQPSQGPRLPPAPLDQEAADEPPRHAPEHELFRHLVGGLRGPSRGLLVISGVPPVKEVLASRREEGQLMSAPAALASSLPRARRGPAPLREQGAEQLTLEA